MKMYFSGLGTVCWVVSVYCLRGWGRREMGCFLYRHWVTQAVFGLVGRRKLQSDYCVFFFPALPCHGEEVQFPIVCIVGSPLPQFAERSHWDNTDRALRLLSSMGSRLCTEIVSGYPYSCDTWENERAHPRLCRLYLKTVEWDSPLF